MEEEFDEAVRHGLPVLALMQDGHRETDQEAFVARVRGSWEHGRVAPTFEGPQDVGLAVVRALARYRTGAATGPAWDPPGLLGSCSNAPPAALRGSHVAARRVYSTFMVMLRKSTRDPSW